MALALHSAFGTSLSCATDMCCVHIAIVEKNKEIFMITATDLLCVLVIQW